MKRHDLQEAPAVTQWLLGTCAKSLPYSRLALEFLRFHPDRNDWWVPASSSGPLPTAHLGTSLRRSWLFFSRYCKTWGTHFAPKYIALLKESVRNIE